MRFNTDTSAIVKNPYHGFIKNTIVTVIDSKKKKKPRKYCIIVEDFRGLRGPIPTDYLKPLN